MSIVKNFNHDDNGISAKDARKMDLFIQYGLAAGKQAIEDAGIENAHRIGAAIGDGIGGLGLIQENCDVLLTNGPRKVSPFFVPSTIINMVAGHLSIIYGFKGPTISIATACTSVVHILNVLQDASTYPAEDTNSKPLSRSCRAS